MICLKLLGNTYRTSPESETCRQEQSQLVSCADGMICSIANMLVMTETLGALSLWLGQAAASQASRSSKNQAVQTATGPQQQGKACNRVTAVESCSDHCFSTRAHLQSARSISCKRIQCFFCLADLDACPGRDITNCDTPSQALYGILHRISD